MEGTLVMKNAMSPDKFLSEMERRFEGKRNTDHKMVQNIADGTATREQIGYLGVLFYHFTKCTPQVISTIHSRCEDRNIRRRIMDTLIDEDTELRCGSAGYDVLAMNFVTRFTGLIEDEVEHHPLPDSIKNMIDYRFQVARQMPVTVALGNSGVASESHAPEMCRMISSGLAKHYSVKDEHQESWIVHIEGDEEHSETALKTVLESCTTRELQDQMLWCIDEYLKHWVNFWDECMTGKILKQQQ